MTNLQKLRAKIIEEIPEIVKKNIVYGNNIETTTPYVERIIRLADVLRVLRSMNSKIGIDYNGDFLTIKDSLDWYHNGFSWNLSKNDLFLQSKETIDFLTNLICKEDE